MDLINTSEAIDFLKELVKEAGKISQKYYYSETFSQKQKEGVDFTTQADTETDKFLVDKLKYKYPFSNFLTEETAPKDYSEMNMVENLWVIDPLDGTVNFSRKNSNFAISIALMNKGEVLLGVVYLPIENKLYYAQSDSNSAFLNEEEISVSNKSELRESVIACDWSWNLDKRKIVVNWIENLIGDVRQIKCMGSAAADLASLAAGKIDVYLHSGLKPWDVAAAGLIVKKAGGTITTPSGEDWHPFKPDVFASNKKIYSQVKKYLETLK